jgi:hypothetical protein
MGRLLQRDVDFYYFVTLTEAYRIVNLAEQRDARTLPIFIRGPLRKYERLTQVATFDWVHFILRQGLSQSEPRAW